MKSQKDTREELAKERERIVKAQAEPKAELLKRDREIVQKLRDLKDKVDIVTIETMERQSSHYNLMTAEVERDNEELRRNLNPIRMSQIIYVALQDLISISDPTRLPNALRILNILLTTHGQFLDDYMTQQGIAENSPRGQELAAERQAISQYAQETVQLATQFWALDPRKVNPPTNKFEKLFQKRRDGERMISRVNQFLIQGQKNEALENIYKTALEIIELRRKIFALIQHNDKDNIRDEVLRELRIKSFELGNAISNLPEKDNILQNWAVKLLLKELMMPMDVRKSVRPPEEKISPELQDVLLKRAGVTDTDSIEFLVMQLYSDTAKHVDFLKEKFKPKTAEPEADTPTTIATWISSIVNYLHETEDESPAVHSAAATAAENNTAALPAAILSTTAQSSPVATNTSKNEAMLNKNIAAMVDDFFAISHQIATLWNTPSDAVKLIDLEKVAKQLKALQEKLAASPELKPRVTIAFDAAMSRNLGIAKADTTRATDLEVFFKHHTNSIEHLLFDAYFRESNQKYRSYLQLIAQIANDPQKMTLKNLAQIESILDNLVIYHQQLSKELKSFETYVSPDGYTRPLVPGYDKGILAETERYIQNVSVKYAELRAEYADRAAKALAGKSTLTITGTPHPDAAISQHARTLLNTNAAATPTAAEKEAATFNKRASKVFGDLETSDAVAAATSPNISPPKTTLEKEMAQISKGLNKVFGSVETSGADVSTTSSASSLSKTTNNTKNFEYFLNALTTLKRKIDTILSERDTKIASVEFNNPAFQKSLDRIKEDCKVKLHNIDDEIGRLKQQWRDFQMSNAKIDKENTPLVTAQFQLANELLTNVRKIINTTDITSDKIKSETPAKPVTASAQQTQRKPPIVGQ